MAVVRVFVMTGVMLIRIVTVVNVVTVIDIMTVVNDMVVMAGIGTHRDNMTVGVVAVTVVANGLDAPVGMGF